MNDTEHAGGISQTLLGMIAGAVLIAVLGVAYLGRGYLANDTVDVEKVPVSEAVVPTVPTAPTATVPDAEVKQDIAVAEPEALPKVETSEPEPVAEPDPETEVKPAPAPEPVDEVETAAVPPVQPPTLDLVRVDPDGSTLIAGKAHPASEVTVLLDGKEIMRATADASGAFVAFLTLQPSDAPRVISLSSQGNGETVASVDQIILAPLRAVAEPKIETSEPQVQVAQAPTAAPETVADPVADQDTDATRIATADEPAAAQEQPAAAQPETTTEQAAADRVEPAEPDEAPQIAEAQTPTATPEPEPEPEIKAEAEAEPTQSPAPQDSTAVAVLRADDTGVELLQSGQAPQVMSSVALDTISYSGAGEVQLSGRAPQGDGFVRVYLDNAAIATLPVDDRGRWRGDLPNVDSGVYTLRIDQVDSAGLVTSRVETPFKREAPEVLAAALADQPSVGPVRAVTVQKGATLWAIARETYGDGLLFVRVFEANRASIKDPDLIYPGQVFALP